MLQRIDPNYLVMSKEGDLFYWPKCLIKDCPYRVCAWLSKEFCYPHSAEFLNIFDDCFTEEEFEKLVPFEAKTGGLN